jgi:hypothetical protein
MLSIATVASAIASPFFTLTAKEHGGAERLGDAGAIGRERDFHRGLRVGADRITTF